MRLTAFLVLALVLLPGSASAADLYIKYKLYALSLPIGSGTLSLDVGKESYSASAEGQTAAFGKLVSDGKGSVEARGGVDSQALQPVSYAYDIKSEDETGTVAMTLRAGKVDKVSVNPPQRLARN